MIFPKVPLLWILNPPGITHPFSFTRAPCWAPDVASEMTQRQNTQDTQETENTPLRPEEKKNCAKLITVYFYKAP